MDTFKSTSLDDIAKYGGMEAMGAGSYGGTLWILTPVLRGKPEAIHQFGFKSTSLDDIAKYGGMEAMGAGSYGGTVWVKT